MHRSRKLVNGLTQAAMCLHTELLHAVPASGVSCTRPVLHTACALHVHYAHILGQAAYHEALGARTLSCVMCTPW